MRAQRRDMKIVVAQAAQDELLSAVRFYAEKGGTGLADALILEFERATRLLVAQPLMGAPYVAGTRRIVLRRFPYNLVYDVQEDGLRIIAVAHQRRKPGYWQAQR